MTVFVVILKYLKKYAIISKKTYNRITYQVVLLFTAQFSKFFPNGDTVFLFRQNVRVAKRTLP